MLDLPDYYVINNVEILTYKGKLSTTEKRNPIALQAYHSWLDQRRRCNNPRNAYYEFYGKKGIEVRYSAREFASWWIHEYDKRSSWTRAAIQRIDPEGHFTFGNITLEEKSEISNERVSRNPNGVSGSPTPVDVYHFDTKTFIKTVKSMSEAGQFGKCDYRFVWELCNGKRERTFSGFAFRYHGEAF